MAKVYGIIVAEDELEDVVSFDSDKEYIAYSNGLSDGANLYGAGGCGLYSLEELEESEESWAKEAIEKIKKEMEDDARQSEDA